GPDDNLIEGGGTKFVCKPGARNITVIFHPLLRLHSLVIAVPRFCAGAQAQWREMRGVFRATPENGQSATATFAANKWACIVWQGAHFSPGLKDDLATDQVGHFWQMDRLGFLVGQRGKKFACLKGLIHHFHGQDNLLLSSEVLEGIPCQRSVWVLQVVKVKTPIMID
ncbi:hypothetical protein lerEdw1_000558, partial [Lerista edwardsae]